jgi:outer membrane receptor protein involved in Fe transport
VAAADTLDLSIVLGAAGVPLDPVVISASRTEETAIDAPAAVSVVGREAIEQAATLAPVELMRDAPGVDFASKGLIQRTHQRPGRGVRELRRPPDVHGLPLRGPALGVVQHSRTS